MANNEELFHKLAYDGHLKLIIHNITLTSGFKISKGEDK